MKSSHHAKTTDRLGRYYSTQIVGALLVECLPDQSSTQIIDLGSGSGILAAAAAQRWRSSQVVTVDRDEGAANPIHKRLRDIEFYGSHCHLVTDALDSGLAHTLSAMRIGNFTIAVCNPPFQIPRWKKHYAEIVEEAGLSGSLPAIGNVDAALLFLAQNLRLLSPRGSLGIIVPDSLVSGSKYLTFRKSLLRQFNVERSIRLPRGSFVGTDAQAHVLILSKSPPTSNRTILSSLDPANGALRSISIDSHQAARRLDFAYHASSPARKCQRQRLLLRDIVLEVQRGRISSSERRNLRSPVLHTSDISQASRGAWLHLKRRFDPSADNLRHPIVAAKAGDILIARVGRNLQEKIAGVSTGKSLISDCLFRVRVPKKLRKNLLTYLVSNTSKKWLQSRAYGVAARQLTKSDLLQLPLPEKFRSLL